MQDPLDVDRSLWQLHDLAWCEARARSWLPCKQLLGFYKHPRALPMIEQYYLTGELPNWRFVDSKWFPRDDYAARHLDLFTFLWLYPSDDLEVLLRLRDAYWCAGFGRSAQDISAGYYTLTHIGIELAAVNGVVVVEADDDPLVEVPVELELVGDMAVLAEVMFGEIDDAEFEFGSDTHPLFTPGMNAIVRSSRWLGYPKLTAYGEKMMLQYPAALRYCQRVAHADTNSVARLIKREKRLALTFHRCIHFSVESEGDTARSRFVLNLRESFREGRWPEALTQFWNKVASGGIMVSD